MLAENRFPEKMNFFYKFLTYNAQNAIKWKYTALELQR